MASVAITATFLGDPLGQIVWEATGIGQLATFAGLVGTLGLQAIVLTGWIKLSEDDRERRHEIERLRERVATLEGKGRHDELEKGSRERWRE